MIDLSVLTEKETSKDAIHAAMQARRRRRSDESASSGYFEEPLCLGSDFIGVTAVSCRSSMRRLTQGIGGGNFMKVCSWYDNEC